MAVTHIVVVCALGLAGISAPAQARFLSPDPAPVNKTDGSNFNRYWYANNNPYKYVDPDGRFPGSHEFNWENRQLGVVAPPRHPDDWLGPALGVALGAMGMAVPDPSDVVTLAAIRGMAFSLRGGTPGAISRLSQQAIQVGKPTSRGNINIDMPGGRAGWSSAQRQLGNLDISSISTTGRGTVVRGATRDGAAVEIRDFSSTGKLTIKVTETGSRIQRMYRFDKDK